ncbi:ABC transporter ATP-binding protein [Porticoccaceae bacterium LTM1]|nr:ABC transporter ATP-binding protein [Porticoccaceae bacterium LTM1]
MIEFNNVNKTYLVGEEPLHALKEISLSIEPGEYVSVMGPSGSGKSTLLNMIGLLDRPDSGTYHLNGTATESLPEEDRAELRRDNIGFIFQSFHLIGRLTAFENIELPLMLAGAPIKQRRQQVSDVLEQVGLMDRRDHTPAQLSGGQSQRVAIARALVMKPRILLADEPTGNLDLASGNDVVQLLEELNQEGITLVVVTHDEALGKRARRRIRMVDGEIASDASTESYIKSSREQES